jgi:hypothetical protein
LARSETPAEVESEAEVFIVILLAAPPAACWIAERRRQVSWLTDLDVLSRLPGIAPSGRWRRTHRLQLRGQPRYRTAFPFHPVAGAPSGMIISHVGGAVQCTDRHSERSEAIPEAVE